MGAWDREGPSRVLGDVKSKHRERCWTSRQNAHLLLAAAPSVGWGRGAGLRQTRRGLRRCEGPCQSLET